MTIVKLCDSLYPRITCHSCECEGRDNDMMLATVLGFHCPKILCRSCCEELLESGGGFYLGEVYQPLRMEEDNEKN